MGVNDEGNRETHAQTKVGTEMNLNAPATNKQQARAVMAVSYGGGHDKPKCAYRQRGVPVQCGAGCNLGSILVIFHSTERGRKGGL